MLSKPLLSLILAVVASGQTTAKLEWHRIGTSAVYLPLPGVATGSVERVWFSADGATLHVRTQAGTVFETSGGDQWHPSTATAPARATASAARLPEPGSRIVSVSGQPTRLYGVGRQVYRSDDGGQNWANLTAYRRQSILGAGLRDIAVSPNNAEEVVVAADAGVWRSVDGGTSWSGLNQSLPNLPIRRVLATPAGGHGVRVMLRGDSTAVTEAEWAPGEKQAWRIAEPTVTAREEKLRSAIQAALGTAPTAVAESGSTWCAGFGDGSLAMSVDGGQTWRRFALSGAGPVEAVILDPSHAGANALAVMAGKASDGQRAHVARTINGGLFWDDLSDNLPNAPLHGIAANWSTGAVFVAGDQGIFYTFADLLSAGPATPWTSLTADLPNAPALDVKLDSVGGQLYAAVAGYGVFTLTAPRKLEDAQLVSTADLTTRIAAPGALVSVLGPRLQSGRLGDAAIPVLSSSPQEMQVQVPFDVAVGTVPLAVEGAGGRATVQMRLQPVMPVIFLDPDGSAWLLHADTGTMVDEQHPARPGEMLQVLCTGLGRVRPDWPAGTAAPASDSPRVVEPVRAYWNGAQLEVKQASLAPGYVGYYLVEVVVPSIVDSGEAELYLEEQGTASNHVRLPVEQ